MPNNDDRLCIFAAPPKLCISWEQKFLDRLNNKNAMSAILMCRDFINNLDQCLAPMKRCRPFVDDEDSSLRVVKHSNFVYRVAMDSLNAPVKPGINNNNNVYFFDKVQIVKRVNDFGAYLTIRWPGLHRINRAYASAMQRHLNEPVVLQNVLFVNMPNDNNLIASLIFARKFYCVDKNLNSFMYTTGRLNDGQQVRLRQLDREWVRAHLQLDTKMEFIMGAVIEGVKRNNKEIQLCDLNNKAVSTNTYSLAVKPMIFIKIES
ncbi:DNA binding protein 1 [Orgyia leucostigma nucleopolyhedrovirus]|uniref:DNA binding protein 1 n=1 Tax=Orgyia leucostigma nucleopolyhedrovirus TaxID=490711 RepID=B0FDN5_9ABAC|nr:DNA binding protein 1 [Orgyia leucostigma nucleopolyhedrovirus]ABY65743.1 DNA binding protein 1 [Orgyia leucostigma nucleopolyhedrovirus]